MPYSIPVNGDNIEKHYYPVFLHAEFSAYEEFWATFIVPLTNRPANIQFKNDAELQVDGHSSQDVCIAQLHYSVFRNLARAYDNRNATNVDQLCAGISALVGAQDTAFDLLERFRQPTVYGAWVDKRRGGGSLRGSKEAKEAWQHREGRPLQKVRDYRNNLLHGRTMTGISVGGTARVPVIGAELKYLDWRLITNVALTPETLADFVEPPTLFADAWNQTVGYIQGKWTAELLPNI